MVNYRRSQEKGGTYFFTVNLKNRKENYLTCYIEQLRESFRIVKQQYPFEIVASVILPDHLHIIWTLPDNDSVYSTRWKAIKSKFTKLLIKEDVLLNKNKKGEYNLWQRRFWEHKIRDELDLKCHVDYIHYNPVKHGHVKQVIDWPHSSFHSYVDKNYLKIDWSGLVNVDEGEFGE